MRAYHLVNEQFGMDDLVKKRLKIATLKDLNDPFELFAVSLTDSAVRRAFRKMKDELSRTRGLLCFSRDWHNPVQWSHYADRHWGLCLGFDVSDESVGSVTYSSKRIAARIEQLRAPRLLDPNTARNALFRLVGRRPLASGLSLFIIRLAHCRPGSSTRPARMIMEVHASIERDSTLPIEPIR